MTRYDVLLRAMTWCNTRFYLLFAAQPQAAVHKKCKIHIRRMKIIYIYVSLNLWLIVSILNSAKKDKTRFPLWQKPVYYFFLSNRNYETCVKNLAILREYSNFNLFWPLAVFPTITIGILIYRFRDFKSLFSSWSGVLWFKLFPPVIGENGRKNGYWISPCNTPLYSFYSILWTELQGADLRPR